MKTRHIPNPLTISLRVVGVAAILMLAAAGAFAKEPPSVITEFSKIISTAVEYPEFLKSSGENQSHYADIKASCDENGKLTVIEVKSNSTLLSHYIKEKLDGKNVEIDTSLIGKELSFKMKFRLV